MKRFPRAALASGILGVALIGCSLFVDLDGLESGVVVDAGSDVSIDGLAPIDAGADSAASVLGCDDPSILADYAFDEGSGTTVHDCSPNHYDGNIVFTGDAGPAWTQGHSGSALAFHEQTCVIIGNEALKVGEEFTASAWVNLQSFNTPNGLPYIVGRRNTTNDGWRLGVEQPNLSFLIALDDAGSEVDYTVLSTAASLNVWTHVAAVYKTGVTQLLYINGFKIVGSPVAPVEIEDNFVTVRIGCKGDDTGQIDGTIDDVRIFNRALSDAEIAVLSAQ